MKITIKSLIMDFFMNNPNKPIKNHIVVEWVNEEYRKAHGNPPATVSGNINQLHHEKRLIHVGFKVYKYDPDFEREGEFKDFPKSVKQAIFRKDNFKCVVCGRGEQDGVKIAADHKIARSKDGTNTLENGQTLCYEHNSMKKNYSQTEAGKRFFTHIYKTALEKQDEKMIAFCKSVFDVYDKHKVDRHIPRPNQQQGLTHSGR